MSPTRIPPGSDSSPFSLQASTGVELDGRSFATPALPPLVAAPSPPLSVRFLAWEGGKLMMVVVFSALLPNDIFNLGTFGVDWSASPAGDVASTVGLCSTGSPFDDDAIFDAEGNAATVP